MRKNQARPTRASFPEPKSPSPFDIGTMCGIPESMSSHFDITSVFLMQMGCILNMTPFWKKNSKLRITLCTGIGDCAIEDELNDFLNTVRIKAQIRRVPWEYASLIHPPNASPTGATENDFDDIIIPRINSSFEYQGTSSEPNFFEAPRDLHSKHIPSVGEDDNSINQYLADANNLIKANTDNTAVTFLYLPAPPTDQSSYHEYLRMLTAISQDLGPTFFIHGLSHVVSTTL